MEITITGATGFIGKELVKYLSEKKYSINIITRNREKAATLFGEKVKIYEYNFDKLLELINKTDVIINLAGENISGGLWTKNQKQKILNSRVKAGNLITTLCEKAQSKPKLVLQASAIGYYGFTTENGCTEQNIKGEGFLADVCENWENSTQSILEMGISRAIIRTGIVLGNTGGILPKLTLPFRFFTGVVLGKGHNYVSWIQIKDYIRAIDFIIQNPVRSEIYNLTAPNSATMREIIKTLSKSKRHLIIISVPTKIINFLLGDMGKEMLLANQKASPTNLLNEGFEFKFKNITSALSDI